jgi:hypothetical protein
MAVRFDADSGEYIGITGAGDLNGDGLMDMVGSADVNVVKAQYIYVILGRAKDEYPGGKIIALTTASTALKVVRIDTAETAAGEGTTVAGIGDVNGLFDYYPL